MLDDSRDIGGQNYLHFYFANARMRPLTAAEYSELKLSLLKKQKAEFMATQKKPPKGMSEETYKVFLDCLQADIDNLTVDNCIDVTLGGPTSASSPGGKVLGSYHAGGLVRHNEQTLKRLSEDLVNGLGDFIDGATKNLDALIEILRNSSQDIILSAISEMDRHDGFLASASAEEIVNLYLKSGKVADGLYSLAGLDKNAENVANRIESIKGLIIGLKGLQNGEINVDNITYNTSDDKSLRKVGTKSELISLILGKLGGNFSAASGYIQEIAVLVGIQNGLHITTQKVNELCGDMKVMWTGAFLEGSIVTKEGDKPLPKVEERKLMKSDVVVRISKDSAVLDYLISVKTSKAKSPECQNRIKIHDSTNLGVLFHNLIEADVGIDRRYVRHIAASHDFTGETRKNGAGSEHSYLTEAYRGMVRLASVAFFTRALLGREGKGNGLLIFNTRVFRIPDIFDYLASSMDAANQITVSGGLMRTNFSDINTWNNRGNASPNKKKGPSAFKHGDRPDRKLAVMRSNKVQPLLRKAFMQAKVTIYLNLTNMM